MKKLLILFASLVCASNVLAGGPIAYSSFTATNDSALLLSATSTNTIVHTLSAVIVSSPSAGGTLKIYNSTFTTNNLVTTVNLGTVGQYQYDDVVLKGIFYTTIVNGSGVTIIYKY